MLTRDKTCYKADTGASSATVGPGIMTAYTAIMARIARRAVLLVFTCFLLVDACVGLNWLLVSFLSHVNKKHHSYAEARLSYRLDVDVCPSVRLSHAGIVSKRLNILSCFLHHTISHSF